jgi:hypothetical protein
MEGVIVRTESSLGDLLIKFLVYTFFFINGVLPAISLFWSTEIFSLQINWFIYPVFISALLIVLALRFKVTRELFVFLCIVVFYLLITFVNQGDIALLMRVCFTLLPFTMLSYFERKDATMLRLFWICFTISITATLYSVYLQLTGQIPYYTIELIDNVEVGRITGGYAKPTALVTFLFPIYLYGFYLQVVQKKRLVGHIISLGVFALVVVIAHRTTTAAFVLIYLMSFARSYLNFFILWYYKYLIPFWGALVGFIGINIAYHQYGLVEALRGRLPMWMIHSEEFWNGSLFEILFGKQRVMLDVQWKSALWALDEVHNNAFRTIIFFGMIGYLLYCLFLRHIVLYLNDNLPTRDIRFIMSACFLYFILFALTNEHTAYPTIIWPTFVWIFLLIRTKTSTQSTTLPELPRYGQG